MSRCITMTLAAILLAATPTVGQTVIYVDADADPNQATDGLSWCSAYTSLDDALATAAGDPNIATIRVADGVYVPSVSADPNDPNNPRTATFQLLNGVTLEGGYAGCGAVEPDARDFDLYETILSGDVLGNDDPNAPLDDEDPLRTDNVYNVVTGSGTDATARLDGFTITAGVAREYSNHREGGGMYSDNGSPVLTHCRFVKNLAYSEGGGACFQGGSPTLFGCTFGGNVATIFGGGMASYHSSVTLSNCAFDGNSAMHGGGIHNLGDRAVLTNCTLSGNTATNSGGGVQSSGYVTPTLSNCILRDNVAPAGAQIHDLNAAPGTVATYSCIQGGWPGNGNIDADPLLSPTLRLMYGSPCIDAGDNTAVPADEFDVDNDGDTVEPLPLDFFGRPRFHDEPATPDTGVGTPPIVDMGACEYQPLYGDCDCDGSADLFDIDAFVMAILFPAQYAVTYPACDILAADCNGDGVAGIFDIDAFIDVILGGGRMGK